MLSAIAMSLYLYTYRGDGATRWDLKGMRCNPVTRVNRQGRIVCVRGRNGNVLVEGENGGTFVVLGRQLRKARAV